MIVQRKLPGEPADPAGAGQAGPGETLVTWYDFQRGANLIQISPDANNSDVTWDLELDNHHSYYYQPARRHCMEIDMPVGILRPDWLLGAEFLGTRVVNGQQTVAWTKADFIDYYADPVTCEPVAWYMHTMKAWFYTVLYIPNQSVPDPSSWLVPPEYCMAENSVAPDPIVV